MSSFATFGNELYTGKRSYNFVGAKKIWFLIAAVAVALSILIPVA
jgi:preprotein translocase subunit SecF